MDRAAAKDCPKGYFDQATAEDTPLIAKCPHCGAIDQTRPQFCSICGKAIWPVPARFLAQMAKPEDTGVGDTIHRLTGKMGKFIEWAVKQLGRDCGCSGRRAEWNRLYPYPKILG
jgi:hypothetical protein